MSQKNKCGVERDGGERRHPESQIYITVAFYNISTMWCQRSTSPSSTDMSVTIMCCTVLANKYHVTKTDSSTFPFLPAGINPCDESSPVSSLLALEKKKRRRLLKQQASRQEAHRLRQLAIYQCMLTVVPCDTLMCAISNSTLANALRILYGRQCQSIKCNLHDK